MINKVIIEGIVAKSSWSKQKEYASFLISLKQEWIFNKFKLTHYFNAYANKPLATEIAKIITENPECKIIIEGKLRTYLSKIDNLYHTSILIEKLINWTPNNKIMNNKKVEIKNENK